MNSSDFAGKGETEPEMQKLISTQIFHAWDDKDRQGWFRGKVQVRGATSTHVESVCSDCQCFCAIHLVFDSCA